VAFLFHSEKFFGLSRSDYLDVLGKGWENGEKRRRMISDGNWIFGSQLLRLPWRDTHTSSHG
jgi:hypothetical protein